MFKNILIHIGRKVKAHIFLLCYCSANFGRRQFNHRSIHQMHIPALMLGNLYIISAARVYHDLVLLCYLFVLFPSVKVCPIVSSDYQRKFMFRKLLR